MKNLILPFLFASLALWLVGCSRDSGAPKPLPAEQISAEFHKAFNRSSPPVKELSDKIIAAVGARNYADAHQAVQMLVTLDDLSSDQRLLVNRAALTIFSRLQEAEAQGDKAAGAALNAYRSSK